MFSTKDYDTSNAKEIMLPPTFEFVTISDSSSHIERLAFPCWKIKPINSDCPYFWQHATIAGVNTFMIYGGDRRAVKPDQVYLRMLAKGNGFQYQQHLKK